MSPRVGKFARLGQCISQREAVKRTVGCPVRYPFLALPAPGCGRGRCGVYWTMGMILLVLWGLGMTAGSTEGYWVHLLLLFSFVAFLLAVVSHGRRAATS